MYTNYSNAIYREGPMPWVSNGATIRLGNFRLERSDTSKEHKVRESKL